MQTKEKQKLVDDMNATIDLEKDKMKAIQKIDLENRESSN